MTAKVYHVRSLSMSLAMLVSDRQKYFAGAARPCRSMPTAFPTIPPFCGGIAREGKPYNIDAPQKVGR